MNYNHEVTIITADSLSSNNLQCLECGDFSEFGIAEINKFVFDNIFDEDLYNKAFFLGEKSFDEALNAFLKIPEEKKYNFEISLFIVSHFRKCDNSIQIPISEFHNFTKFINYPIKIKVRDYQNYQVDLFDLIAILKTSVAKENAIEVTKLKNYQEIFYFKRKIYRQVFLEEAL